MANTATKPSIDEATEILRRLEPVLANLDRRLGHVGADMKDLRSAVDKLGGRVSQLPTLWQTAGILMALLTGIVALAVALFRPAFSA